jgi:hypothetical protein
VGEPQIHIAGVRPGETMREVLTGPGEELGGELFQGAASIHGVESGEDLVPVVDEVERSGSAEERRRVWLAAMAPVPARA